MDFKNENKPLQEDLQARIDERKRKLGKKIFIRRFILILAAFIIIFFISKYAGAFNVKNVKISGNQKTKIEDVVKKGNIKTGASYFTFAGKAARKNIEDLPYVKTAKISLIPFGPVKITIKERVPVSQVEDQGNYYLLDDEYRVLEKMESPKEELPIIENVDMSKEKISDFLFTENDQTKKTILI